MTAWARVVVSVADLSVARALWVEQFGLEVLSEKQGSDATLCRRWNLPPDAITGQLLVATPGSDAGKVHFVQFSNPGAAIRDGAQNFDRCAKNLDVYVDDLPARLRVLKAAGYTFRNPEYSEVTAPNGVRFREIHMHGHDEINIVLLQLLDEPMHFSAMGFAGIGALVTIVDDPESEARWYAGHGFEEVARHVLDGPEIERMIGLPPGSALNIIIMGEPGNHLGQMEIIAYEGAQGENRFVTARPPARGILELELPGHSQRQVQTPAGFVIRH